MGERGHGRTRPWEWPAENALPAVCTYRLHFPDDRRGARFADELARGLSLCRDHRLRINDRPPCEGSPRIAPRKWNRIAPRSAGSGEYRGHDFLTAKQRLAIAIRQLRGLEPGGVSVWDRASLEYLPAGRAGTGEEKERGYPRANNSEDMSHYRLRIADCRLVILGAFQQPAISNLHSAITP